ncbi:MAG TPA: arsinothricin resistance N-acetyltransferase ArsN1 family B [Solirubrobacteraceae bacterium]|jgi:phosphinothricin acetyltransferase
MLIRGADPSTDAAACAEIYGAAVRHSVSSFEDVPPDANEMAARITATSASRPWLVAELDRTIAGYAYASRHRERAAYRWASDVSVYVSADHRRRGVARSLYVALLDRLADQGFQMVCAGIALPNPASVALHESLGFTLIGVYRDIGFKMGRWWDVGWWQRSLSHGRPEGGSPAEPRAPAR